MEAKPVKEMYGAVLNTEESFVKVRRLENVDVTALALITV